MNCIWEKTQLTKVREGYAKGNAKVTSKHRSREGYAKGNAKHFRMMTNLFLARLRFIRASISNFRIGLSQSCTSAWSLDSAGVSGRPPHPQTDPKEFVEFTRSRNKGYAKHFLQFQASGHQRTRFEYWAVRFHMKIEFVIILRPAAWQRESVNALLAGHNAAFLVVSRGPGNAQFQTLSKSPQTRRLREGYAKGNAKHLFSATGRHNNFWTLSYIYIYIYTNIHIYIYIYMCGPYYIFSLGVVPKFGSTAIINLLK